MVEDVHFTDFRDDTGVFTPDRLISLTSTIPTSAHTMLGLNGYRIVQEIHSGVKTLVYRGYREGDQQPAIVKLLKSEYPTLEEVTRLRNEYKIAQPLDCPASRKSIA